MKLLRHSLFWVCLMAIVPLMAVACGDDPTPTPRPTNTPLPTATSAPTPTAVPAGAYMTPDWVNTGKYGGVVDLMLAADPGRWDVHVSGSLTTTQKPSGRRFNQIVEFNPVEPTQVIGDLAKSWELSPDGTTYTFKLHDVTWSDGVPLTSEDIVYSLDRMVTPGKTMGKVAALRSYYAHQTARAIDASTVSVPMIFPVGSFLDWLAADPMKILPKHAIEARTEDELMAGPADLPASGPWLFKEWRRGDFLEYEKNPNYFKTGLPFWDGYKVFTINDIARAMTALLTEQVMGTDGAFGLKAPDVAQMEKDTGGKIRLILYPGVLDIMFFDVTSPPFDDPRVRRAVFLAMDRKELCEVTRKGFCELGGFFIPGTVKADEDAWNWPGYRYVDSSGTVVQDPIGRDDVTKDPRDIQEAKDLVAAAGYENFSADLVVPNAGDWEPNAVVMRQQLLDTLGWDFTLRVADLATFYGELANNTAPLYQIQTAPILGTPEATLSVMYQESGASNPFQNNDPELTSLMDQLFREFDQSKRDQLLQGIVDNLKKGESHVLTQMWAGSGGAFNVKIRNFVLPPTSQIVLKNEHLWFDPDATP